MRVNFLSSNLNWCLSCCIKFASACSEDNGLENVLSVHRGNCICGWDLNLASAVPLFLDSLSVWTVTRSYWRKHSGELGQDADAYGTSLGDYSRLHNGYNSVEFRPIQGLFREAQVMTWH